jgi:hypothetical protein
MSKEMSLSVNTKTAQAVIGVGKNIGLYLSMDGTALSNGELYTIPANREGHGGKRSLTAAVAGTKSEKELQ